MASHRVEWGLEKPLDMVTISVIGLEAKKRRPGVRSSRPIGEWYVIPNRNRQRGYHDEHVTVRVFPKSGTVRVLPGHEMAWPELKVYVQDALFKAGIDLRKCEDISERLIPSERHRTFKVGPVTPFKIDFYRDSLGLTIKANGSHPRHIECIETWPAWIKPLLVAVNQNTTDVKGFNDAVARFGAYIQQHLDLAARLEKESDWRRKELHDIIRNFKECISNLQLDRPHSNTTASSAHGKKNTHCSGSRAGEVNSDGDDVE